MTDRELLTAIYVDMALLKKEWQAFSLIREWVALSDFDECGSLVVNSKITSVEACSVMRRMKALVDSDEA